MGGSVRRRSAAILASVAATAAILGAAAGALPWTAAGLAIAAIFVFAVLLRRHLADLDALCRSLADLAHDRIPARARPALFGALDEASARIAALGRRWQEQRRALDAARAVDEAVLDAIPDPVILLDRSRRAVRANATARDFFGPGIDGGEIDAVLRDPAVLDAIEAAFAGRPAQPTSLIIPGAIERHFDIRLVPLDVGVSEALALVVLHDATAVRRAERMRADFVANVSHELRTPLAALVGFIETIRGAARDDPAARERFLGIMHEQAARMSRLVSDLLSLSKIEQSEHTPPTQLVALAPILGSAADALGFQARTKSIALTLDLEPDLPLVTGDADQLVQVFQNLIDNAIKYGRPNSTVRVSARHTQHAISAGAAIPVVAVAVADEGEGIAREHLPRLTERFYRVDPGRSRQLGGTGLGLAIVKHIVNRHRGALTIDSEPGRGSTFTVHLPSSVKPDSAKAPISRAGPAQGLVTGRPS